MVYRASRFVWITVSILFFVTFVAWQILLRSSLRHEYWQLQLSEVFAVWLYLPLLPLLVGALLLRSKIALLALVLPLLSFTSQYGTQLLPNWQQAFLNLEDAPQLRVMTWNMLYTDRIEEEFYSEIQALKPDVIALQEVGYNVEKKMVALIGNEYPYYRVQFAGNSTAVALWSKLPIIQATESDTLRLGCICIQVTLNWDGRPITFITAHPRSPNIYYRFRRGGFPRVTHFSTDNQDPIFEALVQQVAEAEYPLLLLGDLNTTEQQPNFTALRQQGLLDAHEVAGWGMGFTYPNPHLSYGRRRIIPPVIRIDHILFSPQWRALAAWTGSISVSDHLYMVADLALIEE